MDKVLEALLPDGLLTTFLLIILFLIVQDPNRGFKLKSLLLWPFFKLFNWFKREYVASEVARYLNTFFKKELNTVGGDNVAFKINWVRSEEDPILKNGTVIIRMRKEEDQAKNVLTAAKYALPKVVCPLFRHHIKPSYATSIDLTFLQKFAEQLGNHGKAVFKKFFLNPEIEGDQSLIETLQKLNRLDKFGLLTTIFVNELDYVAEGMFADSDHTDRTIELIQFIEYLNTLAIRQIGEEINLANFSERFRVSTILLARSQIASKKGLIPYLRRLNINLEKGCDSIYIIAFPPAFDFLDKFVRVIDGNQRVTIDKIFKKRKTPGDGRSEGLHICCLRRNKLFTNESFIKKIHASEIKPGMIVRGNVIDCSSDEALVSFLGVDGTIRRSECSWVSFLDCNQLLKEGDVKDFMVREIDTANGNISLTLRFPNDDPWKKVAIPKVNDIIQVYVASVDAVSLRCVFQDLLEVSVPNNELSWHEMTSKERYALLHSTIQVKVKQVSSDDRLVLASVRELVADPWPQIHASLKAGTVFQGKVYEVNEHFVRVSISNGLIGKIPRENLVTAGFEYANYTETMVPGQGIDVVVTKVFVGKKWIRLDLKRNLVN